MVAAGSLAPNSAGQHQSHSCYWYTFVEFDPDPYSALWSLRGPPSCGPWPAIRVGVAGRMETQRPGRVAGPAPHTPPTLFTLHAALFTEYIYQINLNCAQNVWRLDVFPWYSNK
jgi:hypothetical protein